jgi:hypothetical protein
VSDKNFVFAMPAALGSSKPCAPIAARAALARGSVTPANSDAKRV